MQLHQAVEAIKKIQKPTRPILIAIEGFGGSGKSTAAHELARLLGNTFVISIDDFIVKKNLSETSPEKTSFDRGRLERQVLIPASKGEQVAYQKLIWQTDSLSDPTDIASPNFLIIEGISSYFPKIEQYYDYKIWIDAPINIAKDRGQLRDKGNENEFKWELWAQNDLYYQAKYHPELRADLIIENN